jgi:MarR-like DNA-binding transcriptional regulator SgrR of sgrS sRNA
MHLTGSLMAVWLENVPESELSFFARLVYARLWRHAGADGNCYVTAAKLGAELGGYTARHVRRALKELRAVGLLQTELSRGLGSNNSYYFLVHPWMDEKFARNVQAFDQERQRRSSSCAATSRRR